MAVSVADGIDPPVPPIPDLPGMLEALVSRLTPLLFTPLLVGFCMPWSRDSLSLSPPTDLPVVLGCLDTLLSNLQVLPSPVTEQQGNYPSSTL